MFWKIIWPPKGYIKPLVSGVGEASGVGSLGCGKNRDGYYGKKSWRWIYPILHLLRRCPNDGDKKFSDLLHGLDKINKILRVMKSQTIMTSPSVPPYRNTLQQLTHQAGYESLAALALAAGVSDWQLARLEWGLLPHISVGVMVKLAIALNIPLDQLLAALGTQEALPSPVSQADRERFQSIQSQLQTLEQEYQRLQTQLTTQAHTLNAQFQQQVLDTLEPWLLQWPTAAAHAQQNPTFSAHHLLSLTRPIAALLSQWEIEAIATVGELVPYDPRWHEFMGEGSTPSEATLVSVRYVGYRREEVLLYRAKVSLPLIYPTITPHKPLG